MNVGTLSTIQMGARGAMNSVFFDSMELGPRAESKKNGIT